MNDLAPIPGSRAAMRGGGVLTRAQRLLLPVVLVYGVWKIAAMASEVGSPVRDWMVLRYGVYFALSALWAFACFSCGHAVLRRLLPAPLPVLEHVSQCFAVGVLAFFMAMFDGGLAMAYGPTFFVVAPLLLIALGGASSWRYLRRLARHLRYARARSSRASAFGQRALWALGLVAVLLFYLPIVVPAHAGYDSRWYHLAIAEHYVAVGGIRRFAEGWYAGAISHLPSIVYTWAFMLPKGVLFDRLELSAHLEFTSLLMMLPAIPALVRRLVPRARTHVAWIAFFAFPSLYWYDLLSGGDQMAALWTLPIALALLRTYPRLDLRHGLVLGIAVAGLALTKYSAGALIIVSGATVGWRMLWLPVAALLRGAPARAALRLSARGLAIGVTVIALTAPLWLKNWVFYGDPFHPVLHAYFDSRPFTQDAAAYYADYMRELSDYQPKRDWEGVKETLEAVIDHGFQPSHFALEPKGPYRGALFTLMCFCLPFVPASRRLWAMALFANAALLVCYWQSRQDRYFVALMPVMAAVIAATVVLVWRSSFAARASAALLIGLHTLWGLGIFTLAEPQKHYSELVRFFVDARRDKTLGGMYPYRGWQAIGDSMPKDAKVLIHHNHMHTGLGRASVSDWPRTQTGISYGRYRSAAAMYHGLKAMGVTHLVWLPTSVFVDESIAAELRFHEFTTKYTNPRSIGGQWVGTMPAQAPPEERGEPWIAFFGCNDPYLAGLYRFSAMAVPNTMLIKPSFPAPSEPFDAKTDVNRAVARAKYVVWNAGCGFAQPAALHQEFLGVHVRGAYSFFVRKGIP